MPLPNELWIWLKAYSIEIKLNHVTWNDFILLYDFLY